MRKGLSNRHGCLGVPLRGTLVRRFVYSILFTLFVYFYCTNTLVVWYGWFILYLLSFLYYYYYFLSVTRTPRKTGMLSMGQIFLLQNKIYLSIYLSIYPCRLSVSNFFASYNDSGHLGSYLSTQSNENTKITAFLCLIGSIS